QTPDHILPGTSFLIREKLNLNSSCIAMDLNQGCAGYIYGLSAISTFMSSIKAKKGLLLVGDTITKLISPEDNSLIPVFSDAGTATAIEYDENADDIYFDLCADATGYDAIIVPDGGARNPINLDSLEIKKVNEKIKRAPIHLTMNGHDVFNFGFTKVAPSIPAFMKAINITSDDVDYLILHQANKLLNESIRKKAGFTPEKVPYSIEKYGNTSCATIPLTIVSELKDRVYNKQTSFILTGFGVGLSWGNAYIKTERLVCSSVIEI
ncbi:MAG: ketoacyl-ACP synthase III, partial [Flavobacteriales bacterium]|nr:ketoacyl-ACP synthase III [Flavobacteriales bacterium]